MASSSLSTGPPIPGPSSTSISMNSSSKVSSKTIECPLCLLDLPSEHFPVLYNSCHHRACFDCLQQYLKIEISESRINISCPECSDQIHPNDIRMLLNDDNFLSKYEKFMLRRVLCTEPDARWCPAPDCGYVVIATGCAGCPKLQCARPGCDTSFCYHCKQEWHPNQTCDAARIIRNRNNPGSSSATRRADGTYHLVAGHTTIDPVTGQINRDPEIKPCPICKVLVIKMDDGSCNHMTCSVCGTEFCWLCLKQISDLHYLSPSGCTFWGKKPWSRKKKIFWQLGMLVGAPVGIALIAGIAVPAIIIGVPVWVGRRLHAKLEKRSVSKKKKNILVAGGVISSIAVSPILATVTVGIGVPILLAYVYGVVPISLCRSGGCGGDPDGEDGEGGSSPAATGGPSGDVRIKMASDADIIDNYNDDTQSGILGGGKPSISDRLSLDNKINPSIGEVSLVMSMSVSLGSGSHLDRVHVSDAGSNCINYLRADDDPESVSLNPSLNPSNIPLAGSIASVTTTPVPPSSSQTPSQQPQPSSTSSTDGQSCHDGDNRSTSSPSCDVRSLKVKRHSLASSH